MARCGAPYVRRKLGAAARGFLIGPEWVTGSAVRTVTYIFATDANPRMETSQLQLALIIIMRQALPMGPNAEVADYVAAKR